jgi:hypothetical protein
VSCLWADGGTVGQTSYEVDKSNVDHKQWVQDVAGALDQSDDHENRHCLDAEH